MKTKLFLLPVPLFTFLAFSSVSAPAQTVVTFDNINFTIEQSFGPIPSSYQGCNWSTNFACLNAIQFTADGQYPNGYFYGMVAGPAQSIVEARRERSALR